jgi:hypothetical protein
MTTRQTGLSVSSPAAAGHAAVLVVGAGTLPDGCRCPHDHRREDTAIECARRQARRGARG